MQDLKISIVQSNIIWEDREKNLQHLSNEFENIIKTDLIILPEMFNAGFSMNIEKCCETMDGNTIQFMKKWAGKLNCAIIGSVCIKEDDNYYNRLLFISSLGKIEYYDKKHLFRFAGEHLKFSEGDDVLIVNWRGWNLKLLVCYDLRFPIWSRNKLIDNEYEYDCLIYIANWPEKRKYHWKSLLVARAIENMSYCIGVNRVGVDGTGLNYSGNSMIISPLGELICEIDDGKEAIKSNILSASKLEDWRRKFKVADDWDDFIII